MRAPHVRSPSLVGVAVARRWPPAAATTAAAASSATTAAAAATTAAGGAATTAAARRRHVTPRSPSARPTSPRTCCWPRSTAGALEAKGAKITTKLNIGNRETYYKAIASGELDLLPEYTNSLLSYVLQQKDPNASPRPRTSQQQVDELKANLPDNLTVLPPSTAEDKDVIVCNKETADKYSFKTLSDLAAKSRRDHPRRPARVRHPLAVRHPRPQAALQRQLQVVRAARDRAAAGRRPEGERRQLRQPVLHELGHQRPTTSPPSPTTRTSCRTRPCCRSSTRRRPRRTSPPCWHAVNAKLDTDGLVKLMVEIEVDKKAEADVAKEWLTANGFTEVARRRVRSTGRIAPRRRHRRR